MKHILTTAILVCCTLFTRAQDKFEFEKETANPADIKVRYDFPAEGRNNKNGNGYSANVELLNPKPKKVGLISFYLYDPGSGESNNGAWTGVASSKVWRTPEEVGQTQVDGFYNKGIEALKVSFKEANMDLLTPAEFLNTDEKKKIYYSFDEETSGFHKERTTVRSASAYTFVSTGVLKVCPTDKGYRPFFVANEPPNVSMIENFANTGVFGANRKMNSSLGHDLCKALDLDAVVVCYIVTRKLKFNKNSYGVNAVSLYMFGPNPKPETPDDKTEGSFTPAPVCFTAAPSFFKTIKPTWPPTKAFRI